MMFREPRPTQPVGPSFFARHHLTVARELVGARLVWDGVTGWIVETEAYAVEGDEACHTAFRPSAREFFQQNSPGTAYVYLNYGIHWMLNVLALDGIILIRAMEPTDGLDLIRARRGPRISDEMLCAGPGRLGQALQLNLMDHGTSFLSDHRHIEFCSSTSDSVRDQVVADVRVGLTRAADKPWRFLLASHPCLSVPFGRVRTSKSRR